MADNYLIELGKIPASRLNEIKMVVNARGTKEEARLQNPVEERYFDNLVKDAEAHMEKFGFYPVYEMSEIEYDDPVLDIYS